MSTFGLFGLVIAFAGVSIGSVCLLASQALRGTRRASSADTFAWAGAVAHVLAFVALTLCCGLLVFCFMTGDFSIEYVLLEHSEAEGALGVLYRFAGLWAGREGSLLLWAWLISAFNVVVAVRVMKHDEPIDCMALLVSGLVLVAFVAVMLFSESNMPFTATAAPYIDSSGRLTNTGSMQGMNPLLEHWAQAIHPPTLFIGYAGLTIPFAYAIAALIVNDPSKKWVERSSRFAMISWLFLGIGIGLGCVWAYVVLGWGGYWGWDAVENASLLSWCVALALVHSFTVYRKRGAFKRWSIMCACITFAFVITGTFITRSGIVQSVHAFEGDPVSLVLFGGLIAVSMLVGALGLFIRWKSFCPGENDVMESFASRDAAYYFNNVIMIVFTVILCYLTVASALPSWLPFGGQSLSAGTYNAIARPLGVVYCAIIAVCPLLSWVKTDPKTFWKKARIPALCAVVLFVGLMSYFATTLYPAYDAIIQAGGTEAEELASEGPVWYYNGIAVVGFAVASLLFFNTLFLIGRTVGARAKATGKNSVAAFFASVAADAPRFGGYITHLSMSIILVGLIGSSMYVTEKVGYVDFDQDANTGGTFTIENYELRYANNEVNQTSNGKQIDYCTQFEVYDTNSGSYIDTVSPSVTLQSATQQTKLNASVVSFPMEDLFVVYRGVNDAGQLSMDVRVNPLISWVWVGFAMLVIGTGLGAFGRRKPSNKVKDAAQAQAETAKGDARVESATGEACAEQVASKAESVAEAATDAAAETVTATRPAATAEA